MKNSLRECREQMGLTQEELSKRSGISRQTISIIENEGIEDIKSKTMLSLALALNCDVSDIFFKHNVVFTQQEEENEV